MKSIKRKHENKTLDEAKTALADVLKTNIKEKNNYEIETNSQIRKRKINKK